jgi:hypothetical protein
MDKKRFKCFNCKNRGNCDGFDSVQMVDIEDQEYVLLLLNKNCKTEYTPVNEVV